MDLSKVRFEDYRKVQGDIRNYVESQLKEFNINLGILERLTINEDIRFLLENSSIGVLNILIESVKDDPKISTQEWEKYSEIASNIYTDAMELFLRSLGLSFNDYHKRKYNDPRYKYELAILRESCLLL